MYVEGPGGRYILHGWNEYIAHAWLNSATCIARGWKQVEFPQHGKKIRFSNPTDMIYNTLMGNLYF
jgi:hypothetical protein